MLLLWGFGAGSFGRVCEAVSAAADFFSITTLPGLFVVTLAPSAKQSHPAGCDVMQ